MIPTFEEQVKKAFKVSVPIIAVTTADQQATIRKLCDVLDEPQQIEKNGSLIEAESRNPKIRWNIVTGIGACDAAGRDEIARIIGNAASTSSEKKDEFGGEFDEDEWLKRQGQNPLAFLEFTRQLQRQSVVFMMNAQFYLDPNYREYIEVVQSLALLRTILKQDRRLLVLLAPQLSLPDVLKDDIIVHDEPLPGRDELRKIVEKVNPYKLEKPDILEKAVDAVTGLSAFAAEQAVAVSLVKDKGPNIDHLRGLKRTIIRQTPGLSVRTDPYTFSDIGGCDRIKNFLQRLAQGSKPPKAVVHVDELEKAMAGSSSDSSGVTQDILGQVLTFMEDEHCRGIILVGPPGCTKSMIAKAFGNEVGIDTIALDIGGVKQKHVGESEANIRNALKVIKAVSNGESYWIATCNGLAELRPELLRRFRHGIYFFDLPTENERKAIWQIQIKACGLNSKQLSKLPKDDNWTGAEIRNCCETAQDLGITLVEAAKYIAPVAVSSSDTIQALRKYAVGRFLSASDESSDESGFFTMKRDLPAPKHSFAEVTGKDQREIKL